MFWSGAARCYHPKHAKVNGNFFAVSLKSFEVPMVSMDI